MKSSLPSILTFVALAHAKSHAAHSTSVRKAVIAQMFEWAWDSVAAECTTSLGLAGYAFVQVSPAQKHVPGPEWWTDYKPVSYTLTSKRGTRAQYANMVHTCHAAGVGAMADNLLPTEKYNVYYQVWRQNY